MSRKSLGTLLVACALGSILERTEGLVWALSNGLPLLIGLVLIWEDRNDPS